MTRHFNAQYLDYDDETGRAVMVRDEYYDRDDLPTPQPSEAELTGWLNSVVYEEQIDALVHEAEPLIKAWATVAAYYLKHNAQHAKACGKIVQQLYDETRAQIEAEAARLAGEAVKS